MAAFKCIDQDTYKKAIENLDALKDILFVLGGDDVDFVEHVDRQRHIHWPKLWAERLQDLVERHVQ